MPERPAAVPPLVDDHPPLVEARPVRQPPAHLGRAYASAFVETGVLEVLLPTTEHLPATATTTEHLPATATTTATDVSVPVPRTAPVPASVPAPRTAPASASVPAPAPPTARLTAVAPQAPCTCSGRAQAQTQAQAPQERRAGDLLTGVAVGVALGLLAVVLAGTTAAQLGVLPH